MALKEIKSTDISKLASNTQIDRKCIESQTKTGPKIFTVDIWQVVEGTLCFHYMAFLSLSSLRCMLQLYAPS
jgi:hypothetical protein